MGLRDEEDEAKEDAMRKSIPRNPVSFPPGTPETVSRNYQIVLGVLRGETYAQMARAHDITRERIRQIMWRWMRALQEWPDMGGVRYWRSRRPDIEAKMQAEFKKQGVEHGDADGGK